jgi:hypothetical protein
MKKATRKPASAHETNAEYFLKLLLYFVVGTIWIKHNGYVVFPIGLVIGILFTRSDHFMIDRKIEYAVLIMSALMGLIGYGLFLAL